MALSGIKTKPKLEGILVSTGAWQNLFGRSGYRVYPFQPGCMIRTDLVAGTAVQTHGMGELLADDYLIVCRPVLYGQAPLFIPDSTRILRVGSFGANLVSTTGAADDDIVNVGAAVTVTAGEYLFCLGADGSSAPLSSPQLDGATITLYTDNAGNEANPYDYMLTGQGGWYRGWVQSGIVVCDILVTDPSGGMVAVFPFQTVGPEVI